MKTVTKISELQECGAEEQVAITLYLADIRELETTSGKPYARLYFRDEKEAMSVPLWNDNLESAKAAYKIDSIYALTATTTLYKDSIVIKRILSATEVTDQAIVKRFKQHLFKHETEMNCKFIWSAIDALKGTAYSPYVRAFYGESESSEPFSRMRQAFASINHHDNYPGGLVNHIGGMLMLLAQIKKQYLLARCEDIWDIDWQYIIAGILLHDIGKLETYDKVTEATVRFRDDCLLNHNQIGVGLLYTVHNSLDAEHRLDNKTFQQLAYTISYHDDIEKLYEHKRLEDKIISYIDGLEATLAVACSLKI